MLKILRDITGPFEIKKVPWVLLLSAILLALLGALFVRSAASAAFAQKHLIFLCLGVFVFFSLSLIDYRHLPSLCPILYAAGLIALALLPLLGVERNHACRWYSIGPISIQPSEAMKYLVVIVLATYFTYTDRLSRFRDLIIPLALTFAPMILIVGQPDLGTSLLFLPTFLAVAFLALVPIRNLVFLITGGVLFAATMWFTPGALKDYQKQRVISFIDPRISPHSPASYNARQATIAVAGGGFEGQGWGRGVLNQLKRVPERHTDFIFPVIAEEWGFVKTSAVVVFYLMVLLMLARIAPQTPDTFGRLLVGGIMAVFGFQCLLHIAISLRLAPITGLTLPLMSYGGSSMISTFAAFGLVSSVAMRRDVIFSDRPTESKSLAETVASHPGV